MGKKKPSTHNRDLTRSEAIEILRERYPSPDEVRRFPLGELFLTINKEVDSRYDKHIERVFEGMRILLSDNPQNICQQWSQCGPAEFRDFTNVIGEILGPNGYCRIGRNAGSEKDRRDELDAFFYLCTFYHDIGKSIIKERHPIVGWHLVNDVYGEAAKHELFPFVTNANGNSPHSEDMRIIELFNCVIEYHDLFGVMSTGEASLPVMVDVVPLTGMAPRDAIELFSVLMLFNLADVYGSIPEVYPEKVHAFIEDWRILCEEITKSNGSRREFFNGLWEKARTTERTIGRIKRLMMEGTPEGWRNEIAENIEAYFRDSILTGMHRFCNHFALFCKLDYALGFKIKFMNHAHAHPAHFQPAAVVKKLIWLLVELEHQYGEVSVRADGSGRRLGAELAGLNRTPQIGETLAELLLTDKGGGRSWALSECTIWFMQE